MKKSILALVICLMCAVLFTFSLAACGDLSPSDTEQSGSDGGSNNSGDSGNHSSGSEDAGNTTTHTHILVKHDAVEASCIEIGNIEYYQCSDCNKYFSDANGENEVLLSDITIEKSAHRYEHYECTECQTTLQVTLSGINYELNSSKTGYIVTGYTYEGLNTTTLVIPETYNGLPVVEIASKAFYHDVSKSAANDPLPKVTEIYLPDSLEKIGEYAFYHLVNLKYIFFGNSVKYINEGAFEHCESLAHLEIPDSVLTIGNSAFYINAFSNCSLKSVVIGSGVVTIAPQAFTNQKNLTSVIFKDTNGWQRFLSENSKTGTAVASSELEDPERAAQLLLSTYRWTKN